MWNDAPLMTHYCTAEEHDVVNALEVSPITAIREEYSSAHTAALSSTRESRRLSGMGSGQTEIAQKRRRSSTWELDARNCESENDRPYLFSLVFPSDRAFLFGSRAKRDKNKIGVCELPDREKLARKYILCRETQLKNLKVN